MLIIIVFFLYGDVITDASFIQRYGLIILLINTVLFGIYFYLNNINEGKLDGEEIELKHNGKSLIIPVNNIKSITSASNRGDILKGTYSNSYFLKLSNRYLFGKTLILTYKDLKTIDEEPISIQIMRSVNPSLKRN